MKADFILKKKDEALAPVIVAALMFLITIIIVIAMTVPIMSEEPTPAIAKTPVADLEVVIPTLENGHLNTFDIVHKGGDKMVLKNVLVVVEPTQEDMYGNMFLRYGEKYLTAVGKENQKMEAAVSAGDRIRVKMCTGEGALKHITTGIHIIWTVTDMRTKEVIDKGEFVVP